MCCANCAINGGLPAMRNRLDVGDILAEVYRDVDGVQSHVPNDAELPLLFDKVYPVNGVVRVDYFDPRLPPVRRRDLEISQRSDSGTHAASRSQSHTLRLRPLARSIWKPPNRRISCAVWPSSRSRASRDTAR